MNYSRVDRNFDILAFMTKQSLGKIQEYDKNGYAIISGGWDSRLDGIVLQQKLYTNGPADLLVSECFKEIDPKYWEGKRYTATALLMFVYGDNKEQARNRAERLIAHEYEDVQEEEQQDVFELKTLDYARFAKYLVEKYDYAFIDNTLFFRRGDIYEIALDEEIEFSIMDNIYNSKISHRREIVRYIRRFAPNKTQTSKRYILFNNGVYDIEKKKMQQLTNDMVFLNKIPVNYDPDAPHDQEIDNFFNSLACGDKQVATLLIQMISYCLYRDNTWQKFFILKGKGGNGKSTLFELIEHVLGINNISNLELQNFADTFGVGVIRNKLVNMGDDIDDAYIEKCSIMKKAVTGERIGVEEKFQPKYYFKYYGKLIFSANNLPKMSDKSDGMKRRLVIVPMNADFRNGNGDDDILDKITTTKALQYLLKIAMDQLHIILKDRKFIECTAVNETTDDYNSENNPIIQFLKDMNGFKFEYSKGKRLPLKYVFALWQSYSHNNNIKTNKSLQNFKQDIEMNMAECGLGLPKLMRRPANIEEARKFQLYQIEYRSNEWFIDNCYIVENDDRQLDIDYANETATINIIH